MRQASDGEEVLKKLRITNTTFEFPALTRAALIKKADEDDYMLCRTTNGGTNGFDEYITYDVKPIGKNKKKLPSKKNIHLGWPDIVKKFKLTIRNVKAAA